MLLPGPGQYEAPGVQAGAAFSMAGRLAPIAEQQDTTPGPGGCWFDKHCHTVTHGFTCRKAALSQQHGRVLVSDLFVWQSVSLTTLCISLPALPLSSASCRWLPGARLSRPQQQQCTCLHHCRPASLPQQRPSSRSVSAGARDIPACRAAQGPCFQPASSCQAGGRGC